MDKLIFSKGSGNSKLAKIANAKVYSFSIPAGETCPAATICKSSVSRDGVLTDFGTIRCFEASMEVQYKQLRAMVWHNFDILRAVMHRTLRMVTLIEQSLPHNATHIRIHVGGDYFTRGYYMAWQKVAMDNPHIIFYGYTKMIPFLLDKALPSPDNFRITASIGGTFDALAYQCPVYARIVYSQQEADELGLEIDHDDTHAINFTKPYALLIHGTQPKGSLAGKAVAAIRKLSRVNIDKS